ncbi:ABC transporter ATP-binding protein [Streptomyces jeddahensis]|uniref:Lipoprotein-releasing system ATP-binding protein LolD n=1 Tax=Streptomyces jeddahensis TaxID=1716141 RepID=A0A177HM44_9ACTN|nr:ABC transporter ATP-binding protein [Streptomyces jeddahensis]OAH11660.1 lipoprotein-releasing system ATP-binding protein LolD [Streptomyces jeddahensis]
MGDGASVRVEDVRKSFGTGDGLIAAVDGISLDVPAGRSVALVGASGSGKSTLLHLIGAIERPDAGRVVVDGQDVTGLGRRAAAHYRRTVGFVFQRFHLLPGLSALDNVLAPVLPRKAGFDRDTRARELLAAVGLAGRETALPSQLSGGQQQRVAVARALIGRPRLLLADEPTGSLDSATGEQLMDLVSALAAEHGCTLMVATHDMGVAERCADVVRLRDGKLTGTAIRGRGWAGPARGGLTGPA